MFKLGLEKAEVPEIKLPTSIGSQNKQETSRKTSASLTTLKPLAVWITTNCRKFFRRWEYQTTWPASWEICMQVKKQQLESDMEQQTGSKLGKECICQIVKCVYVKIHISNCIYCHLAYLTYMQSTSCEMPDWMKHQLEWRLPGEINNIRYADDTRIAEVIDMSPGNLDSNLWFSQHSILHDILCI